MKIIYKYNLNISPKNEIEMPQGSKILSVQIQYEDPVLWALGDTEKPLEKRSFLFIETGAQIDEEVLNNHEYISTVQCRGGRYILHLFERNKL